ncbi:LEAF RUST 10 DISEASE-RESISTANCE LOCUS RECEPTOR-LIKE PROTEIN KINASE-like 1.2 isoform X2 [Daucus carota subsp. sativus]|uniref:LEAF RUST 10 DISEASE-RESISTANCE LOCUS RECEPTOR-LIKE PROTEIN KINASE-like 1.2 isoform X2 n=1 Tax=Daucus carota subsp. sativus TaxID=79200 RepID=UPI0007F041D5|nr:PREDICTED: LEAF RUST 10 DISEASE-RESISTANCE LOCUS RECEPTOR-LIKE PROTEIN KINASE-like 1.2 isoform X2 [Daucus carota subsp. sativus]
MMCFFVIRISSSICLLCLLDGSFCEDQQYEDCNKPVYCGKQNVQFPFYIQEAKSCGSPGFELSCEKNDSLILEVSDDKYQVKEIFYSNNSLRVSNLLSSDGDLCSLPKIKNLELPSGGQFQLHSTLNLILSSDCDFESGQNFSSYRVGCDLKKNDTDWVLVMRTNDTNIDYAYGACKSVILAPVDDHSGDDNDYLKLLRYGFILKWSNATNCSDCEASGGNCVPDGEPVNNSRNCNPHHKTKSVVILGIVVPGACIFVLLGVSCILWRHKKLKHRSLDKNTSSDIEYGTYFGVHVFSYKELEEATHNFDPSKAIGEGGFGTVYYGKLRDGREVAVKRCYENSYRRVEQFMNEIHILTLLRHRNLVLLYGSTSHQSGDLLLVYEYISNGTLADHIHGDKSNSEPLTWPVRMNIAIETARALSYLHRCDIIHRDVKTNNILLDNNFCVKVADFGLSRLFPTDVTHVSTAPQGTPGYVDPDYHQCYQLTGKSDVYSFGVVLVELISSLPAVDINRQRNNINLANLAIDKIQRCALHELIDPDLGQETTTARMTTSVAALAYRCLQLDKDSRPSMDEVLECLEQIQDIELPKNAASPLHEGEDRKLINSPVAVTDKWLSTSTTLSTSK